MSQSTNTLNPQQRAAIEHGDGPLLVLAGAGSGKTRVITERIAFLIRERGVAPENILGVTFTNKAAAEMKQRVTQLIGPAAKNVTLSTFHSLGLRILRQDSERLGYSTRFTIYNDGDQLSVIRTLLREHPMKREKFDPGILLNCISRYKNQLTGGDAPLPTFNDKYDLVFEDIFNGYQNSLRACQAVDFDDLILLPIRLFVEHPDALENGRRQYPHILVDEYQDTNPGQYRLLMLLASGCESLCVVGDDDQSIYAWRGAEVGNILRFEKDWPGACVIKLEQNYRSTQVILDAAYHVIKNNAKRQEKRLWTKRSRGRLIDAFVAKDEVDEARAIAHRIETIKAKTEAPWAHFAVLYRSNLQSRALETTLRAAKIPYDVMGGYDYFERKEVKDIVAYLKVVQNPNDDLSVLRVLNYPRRGIGDHSIIQLGELARGASVSVFETLKAQADNPAFTKTVRRGIHEFTELIEELRADMRRVPLNELVRSVIERTRYREELERTIDDTLTAQIKTEMVEELASAAASYSDNEERPMLAGFIDAMALNDALSINGKKRFGDAVRLATLHSAKGLEFPFVFLCGMEENLFPHARAIKEYGGVDEERRLCYVGITRAQRHLTLSFAQTRNKFGRQKKSTPSRFIHEISPELLSKQFSHSENYFDQQKTTATN